MAARVLQDMKPQIKSLAKSDPEVRDKILAKWLEKNQTRSKQIESFFSTIRKSGTVDMSMLIIAEQRLRHLYGG